MKNLIRWVFISGKFRTQSFWIYFERLKKNWKLKSPKITMRVRTKSKIQNARFSSFRSGGLGSAHISVQNDAMFTGGDNVITICVRLLLKVPLTFTIISFHLSDSPWMENRSTNLRNNLDPSKAANFKTSQQISAESFTEVCFILSLSKCNPILSLKHFSIMQWSVV